MKIFITGLDHEVLLSLVRLHVFDRPLFGLKVNGILVFGSNSKFFYGLSGCRSIFIIISLTHQRTYLPGIFQSL